MVCGGPVSLGASPCCIYMYADGEHEHTKDNVVLSPVSGCRWNGMHLLPAWPCAQWLCPQCLYLAMPAGSCCFTAQFSSVPLRPGHLALLVPFPLLPIPLADISLVCFAFSFLDSMASHFCS